MVAFAKQSVYGSEKKQEMGCHCWSGGGYVHQFDRSSNDRLHCSSLFAVFFHVVSSASLTLNECCEGPNVIVLPLLSRG